MAPGRDGESQHGAARCSASRAGGLAQRRDAARNRGAIGDGGVAPNTDAEAWRQRRNALRPTSRRLGWGLAERRWSSTTNGLGRRARDGEGGPGGVGARRSAVDSKLGRWPAFGAQV
jgi:hypothetical protein